MSALRRSLVVCGSLLAVPLATALALRSPDRAAGAAPAAAREAPRPPELVARAPTPTVDPFRKLEVARRALEQRPDNRAPSQAAPEHERDTALVPPPTDDQEANGASEVDRPLSAAVGALARAPGTAENRAP